MTMEATKEYGKKYLVLLSILALVFGVSFAVGNPQAEAQSAERELVEGQDFTATTPALATGQIKDGVTIGNLLLDRYISFNTLQGNGNNELVITRVSVTSSGNATYSFKPLWAITKDGAKTGSNYRECNKDCSGANGLTFDINIADNNVNSFKNLATWANNQVKVFFKGGGVDNLNQYSFKVYGYYANQDPFATSTDAPNDPSTGSDTSTPTEGNSGNTDPNTGEQPADPNTGEQPADPNTGEQPADPMERSAPAQPVEGTAPEAQYSSTWLNNPGTSVSRTHEVTKGSKVQGAFPVTDKFLLGCSTGSSIQQIKWSYDDGRTDNSIQMNQQLFAVKIGSILDSFANNKVIGPVVTNHTTVGYEYDLGGEIKARIVYSLENGIKKKVITIDFLRLDNSPVYIDIPASTPAQLRIPYNYAFDNYPNKIELNVKGTCGATAEPTQPGGADQSRGDQICSPTGGSGWVAYSKDASSSYSGRLTTTLARQTYGSTAFQEISTSNWIYNGLAYNPRDGYLYAVSQGRIRTTASNIRRSPTYDEDPNYPAGHLLRISPQNGAIEDMGRINNIQAGPVGTWPNDLWGGITSGMINAQGIFTFSNSSSSGTKNLYTLDLSNVQGPITWSATRLAGSTLSSNDYTYMGKGDTPYVFGVVNDTNTIERINIQTGQRATFSLNGLSDAVGNTMPTGTYGTAWTYGNGDLGFGLNKSNLSYQVRITDNTATGFKAELVSVQPAPNSWNNDAASNSLRAQATDLKIEKKLDKIENGVATWTIKVTNLGPCGSSGFTVTDSVPNIYRDIKVSYDNTGWVTSSEVPSVNSSKTVLQAKHGPIGANQTATLTLTARVADSSNGICTENKATVEGLEQDEKPDNNTATDARCGLAVEKKVVDQNNDGNITAEDSRLPGPDGSRAVQYDLIVKGPKEGNATPYTIKDLPQFTEAVDVTGAKVVSVDGGVPSVLNRQFTAPLPPEGWQIVGAPDRATIGANSTHSYRLEVYYKIKQGINLDDPNAKKECKGQPYERGNGLFNSVTLTSSTGEIHAEDCAPIGKDENVNLAVEKVGYDGESGVQPQPIESGVEFKIYRSDEQGRIDMSTLEAEMSKRNPVDGETGMGYYTASLKPDTFYYLVETKSPAGYQLLAQPVLFKVVKDSRGIQQVKFYKPGDTNTELRDGDGLASVYNSAKNSPAVAFMQIADVQTGELPKTGGAGVGVYALIAAALAGMGVYFARRRKRA